MRQPDRRGANVEYHLVILVVVELAERPAFVAPFLVARNAVNGIRPAIQKKTLLLGNLDRAQSQRLADFVKVAAVSRKADRHRIEIRIFAAVPQMRLRQFQSLDVVRCRTGRKGNISVAFSDSKSG